MVGLLASKMACGCQPHAVGRLSWLAVFVHHLEAVRSWPFVLKAGRKRYGLFGLVGNKALQVGAILRKSGQPKTQYRFRLIESLTNDWQGAAASTTKLSTEQFLDTGMPCLRPGYLSMTFLPVALTWISNRMSSSGLEASCRRKLDLPTPTPGVDY